MQTIHKSSLPIVSLRNSGILVRIVDITVLCGRHSFAHPNGALVPLPRFNVDANPDEKATERFLIINRAYEVLTDPELKKQYDEYGVKGIGTSADSDQRQKQYNPPPPPPAKPIKGDDLRFDLDVDYDKSLYGGQQLVQVTYRETCEDCDGTGIIDNVEANDAENTHTYCQSCRGQGSRRQRKQIMVQVPRGIHSGNVLRIRGEGLVGDFGGANGDIYIFFQVQGGAMHDDPYGYEGGGGYDGFDFHNVDRISHVEASVGGAIWQTPDFEQYGRGQQHYNYY
jgi:molecular chaperone DnaJ